jgi:hypothetical protein
MKSFIMIGSILAVILHGFICFGTIGTSLSLFLLGLFIAGCLPYAAALLVLRRWPRQKIGVALAVGLCLLLDIVMYLDVTGSTSSTASFGYLMVPPINLFILLPVSLAMGAIATLVLGRFRGQTG